MERYYRRNMNQSYMILEGEDIVIGYEEKILQKNEIAPLLSFHSVVSDGKLQFWYDITGKISLRDFVSTNFSMEILKKILWNLQTAFEEIQKYLLLQRHILLDADSIFIERKDNVWKMFLVFCPWNDSKKGQMEELMDFFLSVTDYKEESVTKLCYQLYEKSIDNASVSHLLNDIYEWENEWENEEVPHEDENEEKTEKEPEQEVVFDFTENALQENKEEKNFFEKIFHMLKEKISDILREKKEEFIRKKESLFPKKKEMQDFVFEPTDTIYEPTELLTLQQDKINGQLLYEGDGEEKDHTISKHKNSIGSSQKENDIILNSPAVSRRHARIIKEGERYYLEDMNSTNGTYINGETINYSERKELQKNDKIIFADVSYRIV